ncbi:substrate-binding periplasmic protein [Agarivorans sp.]|uniref:substrate-binding periplasmic protein n=1 Tax=Agarivorans sp. TaxID=1872412 RepID=UPI003D003727
MIKIWQLAGLAWLLIGAISSTQAKDITLATSKSIPPYIIEQNQSGIQLDIIRQAFDKMGHKVTTLIFTSNLRAERMLNKSAVDAIVNAPNNTVDNYLSDPVIYYQNVAISLTKRQVKLDSVADLANYRFMAFQNAKKYLGAAFNEAAEQAKAYTEVANQQAQIERLYRAQVEVIVMDKQIYLYLSQQLAANDAKQAVTFHPIFKPSPRLLGFHDKHLRDQFNQGLKMLKREHGIFK